MSSSPSSVQLTIRHGSILEFFHERNPQASAIVNAANQVCLGGGGLDSAINKAGGPQLRQDRKALPILRNPNTRNEVRCPKGEARATGPGNYGSLKVPYVIHAVGADYRLCSHPQQGDDIVQSAYRSSLEVAEQLQLEAIAFPLLSSGAFRASRDLKEVIKIGLQTMQSFPAMSLKHIYVYAFDVKDFGILQSIMTQDLGMRPTEMSYALVPTLQPFQAQHASPSLSPLSPPPPSSSRAPVQPVATFAASAPPATAPSAAAAGGGPPPATAPGYNPAAATTITAPSAPSSTAFGADLSSWNILPPPVGAPPPATAPGYNPAASSSPPATTAPGYHAAVFVHHGGSSPSPLGKKDIAQLNIIQGNFHALIRHEVQQVTGSQPQQASLPNLVDLAKRDDAPTKGQYYAIPGMNGGYDTQLVYDAKSRDWSVTCTTWIKGGDQGTRPKHSITKDGLHNVA